MALIDPNSLRGIRKTNELLSRSSLRVAEQWVVWLQHALVTMDYTHGHERLLRDTAIACHHNNLNCARRLRKNPGWGMSGSMRDDTVNLHAEMLEARAHYLRNRPKFPKDDSKLKPLYDMMDGLVNQQVRLASEVQRMQDEGAINISVTTDRPTADLIRGTAITEKMHS